MTHEPISISKQPLILKACQDIKSPNFISCQYSNCTHYLDPNTFMPKAKSNAKGDQSLDNVSIEAPLKATAAATYISFNESTTWDENEDKQLITAVDTYEVGSKDRWSNIQSAFNLGRTQSAFNLGRTPNLLTIKDIKARYKSIKLIRSSTTTTNTNTLSQQTVCPCEDDDNEVTIEEQFVYEDKVGQKLPYVYKTKALNGSLVELTRETIKMALTVLLQSDSTDPAYIAFHQLAIATFAKMTNEEIAIAGRLLPCTNSLVPVIAMMIMKKRNVLSFDANTFFSLVQDVVDWVGKQKSQTFLFSVSAFWDEPNGNLYKKINSLISSESFQTKFKVDIKTEDFKSTMLSMLPGINEEYLKSNRRICIKLIEGMKWGALVRPKVAYLAELWNMLSYLSRFDEKLLVAAAARAIKPGFGWFKKVKCNDKSCNNWAIACSDGELQMCTAHGGGNRCIQEGCKKGACAGKVQMCSDHGGGKRCIQEGCNKGACAGKVQMCIAHGGGNRCIQEGYKQGARKKDGKCSNCNKKNDKSKKRKNSERD